MNIVREDINAELALLKVKIAPADYQPKVDGALEKYRKQASIPGFRPGKVPLGMIRKQYGKSVLAEELNKVVNDSLHNYITEQKIDILGNPIPKEDFEIIGDFNNPSDFEFAYEIGLSPQIEIKLSSKDKFDYYKIKVDAKEIDQQIEDLRKRYGKLDNADVVSDNNLVLVQFVELNDDETIKEGGIMNSSTVAIEFIEDKATKKAFVGKKVGDKLIVDPRLVSRGGKDTATMLGLKEEDLPNLSAKFQLTINQIREMVLADLDQNLFDKVFGEGSISTEKELRARMAEDMAGMYAQDADRMLTRDVYEHLLKNTTVKLPKDFLKRWIQMTNEKPVTLDEIEAEYEHYEKSMKWQLIQSHIFKTNGIKLEGNEVMDYTKALLVNQYAQYGIPAPDEKELNEAANKVLSNREESSRVYDMLVEAKLSEYFKNTVKQNEKLVSQEEFAALASK